MTKQLQVLLAVKALVAAALPDAEIRGFDGETSFPEVVPGNGMVIGYPSDPGDPEIDLSPPAYTYSHDIRLEVSPGTGARALTLDEMIAAIGVGVQADPYLGGLCSSLTATAPLRQDRTEQEATIVWAELGIVPEYTCDNPLA